MLTIRDYIKEALDAVQPSLGQRDYLEAARVIRSAIDSALGEKRIEQGTGHHRCPTVDEGPFSLLSAVTGSHQNRGGL